MTEHHSQAVSIRNSRPDDIAQITSIFAHEVRHGTASWSYQPPAADEMLAKFSSLQAQGYPFLSAVVDGEVAGYCHVSAYRPREGYRFLVENSIYIDQRFRGRGIARQLLLELIDRCTVLGFRQMIAVIGDSQNLPSIRLHASVGFERVGLLPNIGYKFDRWLDSVLMQQALGDGPCSPAPLLDLAAGGSAL